MIVVDLGCPCRQAAGRSGRASGAL